MAGDFVDYLYSLAPRGSKPGLERIFCALHDLGDPQNELRVINVTGTNGKGSYCTLLADILSRSGYRTGVFSSPHLEDIRESITLDGEMIPRSVLSDILERIHHVLEAHELTQFEALTVSAIMFFKESSADIVVMEVGMGGEKDATNVFSENLMSVILGVSLDHTSFLGSSLKDIALEKSGIMKKGCPVFCAVQDKDALEVIHVKAAELNCEVYQSKSEYEIISRSFDKTSFKYRDNIYHLNGGALYQVANAVKVLDSLSVLRARGIHVSQSAVISAFSAFYRPARFEIFSVDPVVIFDGGHNPECTEALVHDLSSFFGDEKLYLIVGVMADKDVESICRDLSKIASKVFTVAPNNPRALNAEALCEVFESFGVDAHACHSFEEALIAWRENGSHPLVCAGSLYSYAEFKKAFNGIK